MPSDSKNRSHVWSLQDHIVPEAEGMLIFFFRENEKEEEEQQGETEEEEEDAEEEGWSKVRRGVLPDGQAVGHRQVRERLVQNALRPLHKKTKKGRR